MEDEQISLDKWFDKKISLSVGKFLIIITILFLFLLVIKLTINRDDFRGNSNESRLEIGQLIRDVKMELMKADTQRIKNNEPPLFRLKNFQMEISFIVRSVTKGGATIDYKFVTVEGSSETGNEKVQKLILNWDAIIQEPDTMPGPEDSPIIIKPTNH